MKRSILLLLVIITNVSCASYQGGTKPKLKLSKDKILVKRTSIHNDFLSGNFTELKFSYNNEVEKVIFSKKGVFDKFGKWDKDFYLNNTSVYLWDNVKLFPNSDEIFSILAFGTDSPNFYTSSIIIFDSKGQDVIKTHPKWKNKIIDFYVDLVNNMDYSNRKFNNVNRRAIQSTLN
ncbi:hypothetical protein [Aureivirga marina]|uniref:hypothetical protein n=1 Tax=Aureivirga marina TaxID=1182451 RepID=UPI0018CA8B7A|nr:hypothetical protein [Aureivirga marina]